MENCVRCVIRTAGGGKAADGRKGAKGSDLLFRERKWLGGKFDQWRFMPCSVDVEF